MSSAPQPGPRLRPLRKGEHGMAKVIAGITISLDGYVTGPNDRLGAGLGEGGERLHHWVFGGPWTYDDPRGSPAGVDQDYIEEVFASGGAWIVGRTMHDVVDGWGDDPGFGVPVFVVTHREHETVVKGDTTFEFVTAGIAEAMERAREAAAGKNVIVMRGGTAPRAHEPSRCALGQLAKAVVARVQLHPVPMRLFEVVADDLVHEVEPFVSCLEPVGMSFVELGA